MGWTFTPIGADAPGRPADFPKVSPGEQAARDATAEGLVADELATVDTEHPEAQAALEKEYRTRFGRPAPTWKFTPLQATSEGARGAKPMRFVPLDGAPEEPPAIRPGEVLKNVALNNPLTAAAEAGLNFGSQMVALPVAGLAGLATEAGNFLGLTDRSGANVVRAVGDSMTYQPRGAMGAGGAAIVAAPFEKLAEVGEHAGSATLDATGSPALATAVDTTIQGILPLVVGPAVKAGKAKIAKASEAAPEAKAQSNAYDGGTDGKTAEPVQEGAQRVVRDAPTLPEPEQMGLEALRRQGSEDLPSVDRVVPELPGRHGAGAEPEALAGAVGREQGVQPRQLRMDNADTTGEPARLLPEGDNRRSGIDRGDGGETARTAESDLSATPAGERTAAGVADGEALPPVDVADLQRGDAATAGMVAADGALEVRAALPDQGRDAGVADPGAAVAPKAARYALVEADDLKASHDVDLNRQPENHFTREGATRHETEKAVQGIVGKFDPERLGKSLNDAEGAPIVGRDGIVEAGQRRAIALQRIYQANGEKANRYRDFLRETSDQYGIRPDQVDAMRKPVLVRVPEPVRAQVGEPTRPAEMSKDDQLSRGAVSEMSSSVQNSWAPGANYVPLVDSHKPPLIKATSVDDLPAPKRREHIINRFAKAIGTTVYEGRVKGKRRLGFFRPKVQEVRIKNFNDIEVAAHEIAHLIDHRVTKISSAWRSDKALREELKSVSYDQKSVPEGFAEAVRLFLTQPETLEAKAPKAFAWLDDFTKTHEYGPALKQAQADMTGWFGQDALNRARSKIGTEKPLAEYFDRFWDRFRQSTVDDLHGVYNMERTMTGKVNPNGPYESARLSRASASIADGAVRFGYPVKNPDGSFKFAGKGLEEILQPVSKNLEDALLYFVGRSARELHGQGREHLFTTGEIDAMLRLRTPEREQAFKGYQEWNRGILDFAEAQGIINPEARRLWQRTQYLPFHRVDQPGGLKGKPGDWAGVQALTGGTTNIKDVLGNIIGNASMLIDKAVKNEARRKIANLSQQEGGGKFMVKIDQESRPVKISGDQVLDAMFKKYGIAVDGDAPAFFEFLIKGQPPAGNNVVAIMQGGKPIWFEVGDPILYRSLKAIDRPLMSTVAKVLGWPKRIGQASITTMPEFWIANMARDTLMGSVMSQAGFRPVIDSLKGMASRMTSDPAYKDYLANGGGLSSIFLDETNLRAKLEKFYRNQGIDAKTVIDAPGKLLNLVETLGDAFEMSTRLGEYKRAIARGEHPRHAAYMGREVSTDFAARGDSKSLGFLFDTVMFLKPALLSWDRLYRGIAHDPNKGAIAAKAGMMATFSAALYLLNRNDPRYADLQDWDRDANWHFFVGDQHFRWPKIWEIGAMSSAAERSVEKIIEADPQGLGKDFARILGATFNVNLMPQIVAPMVEQYANRSSFTKAPIETPGMENLQPFLRAKPGTSETMKAAGMATRNLPESLQVNPVRAEALLRGYFNTWAMYGLMLSDQAFHGDKVPEKRTDELPVVRRFYSQEPAKHTKYESEFYDLLSEAKRLRGTMKELDTMGLRDYADAKEQEPLATEAKPLERAAKNLGAINNESEKLRRDGNLTPREKREKLDTLTVERNALLKAAVLDSKTAQKARAMTPADVVKQGIRQ